jgi:hypothetical protein
MITNERMNELTEMLLAGHVSMVATEIVTMPTPHAALVTSKLSGTVPAALMSRLSRALAQAARETELELGVYVS